MADAAYVMAFTAGALLLRESVLAAELYARLGDWGAVRQGLRTGNLLQIRTASAAARRGREVVQRLAPLGYEPAVSGSSELAAVLAADLKKWERLVREVGIRAE